MQYDLLKLARSHKENSFGTQASRRSTITAFVKALDERGFSRTVRQSGVAIKERHVQKAVHVWQGEGISSRTICNRLSHIRRFCEWQGKPGVLKSDNCSGLRTSGVVLENIASWGSDYLRMKLPSGSH